MHGDKGAAAIFAVDGSKTGFEVVTCGELSTGKCVGDV
jgi:hypothetical protein